MKTELLDDSFNLRYLDTLIHDHIENNSNDLGGKEMTIAILPPIEPKKYLNPVRPYRTITATGLNEFFSITNFLEEHGLICINKDSDAINGFNHVFFIPEDEFYELYPENDPDYEKDLNAIRAMFRK
ncbi:hypothetical protein [Photobacterium halotolerans]|uniref:hypothetical protein n=1 Tax=Photobacterium halotolerans TaxID=265726 RepID=UPI001372D8E0|nr:hypothetical protein [Photobacterium halotolerans]NAW86510.1 hypothetical protein [Photobacterium halotolerans]